MSRRRDIIDMTGQRFGRLVVTGLANIVIHHATRWICLCDCGRTTVARRQRLLNGMKISCGCIRAETSRRNVVKGQEALRRAGGGRITPPPPPPVVLPEMSRTQYNLYRKLRREGVTREAAVQILGLECR